MSNTTSYTPPTKILQNYAKVLVNFALNSGEGVKKGETVQIMVPDVAKEMARHLQNEVLKAGAHPLMRLLPTGFDADYYKYASDEQLTFFPKNAMKARADLLDHNIYIIADPLPFELKDVDPKRIVMSRDSRKQYRDWLNVKENNGKFTWTIALWGVEAKAKEVGLSMKEYWAQIIKACFLDKEDPIAEWKKMVKMQKKILKKLNNLKIEWLHMTGSDVDLKVKLGKERQWNVGSGRNIPSFECFTSPDWRGTEGWIKFNQPVYRYGNMMSEVFLRFEKGLVVEAKAKKGQKLLDEMLKSPNANKVGEFSLTDKRMTRITHTMAETLFDENIGGPFGNSHIALGMAYKDCYHADPSELTEAQWEELGYNDSAEHTDIVTTTDRTVVATLADGSEVTIYRDGEFVV